MPFLFIIVGTVMVISAVKGTSADLLALLKGDFTGKGNFIYWTISILIIGAVGYIPDLKPVSRAFLVLVVVVLFLDNKGVFAKGISAINQTALVQKQINTPGTTQSTTGNITTFTVPPTI